MRLLIILLLLITCVTSGCSTNYESNVNEEMVITDETVSSPEETENSTSVVYAEDDIINKFINDFNNNSVYDMTDVSKGNIRIKYHGTINGHWVEMISHSEGLSISINGGQDDATKQSMFDVFGEVLKIVDPTLTGDKISEVRNYLNTQQYMVSAYVINDNLTIGTYVPITELSYGNSTCRIDLVVHHYK